MKTYHVYILTNVSRSSLYTGVTSKLVKRDFQHEIKFFKGFTAKYNVNRLVYYEAFFRIEDAIAREKQIKGWRLAKKIALIEGMNPKWGDLSRGWENCEHLDPSTRHPAPVKARGDPGSLRMTASICF